MITNALAATCATQCREQRTPRASHGATRIFIF
jgi:hypothetical protein